MGFRYIGVKTAVIDEVLTATREAVGDRAHVADLMCGTAAVSVALREQGYRVTANDLMTYSYHHARVMLLFSSMPEFADARGFIEQVLPGGRHQTLFPLAPYEAMIQALNLVSPQEGYFWREFSRDGRPQNTPKPRNYFSPENARKIDGMRACVRWLRESRQISDLEHSLLLHDLIMAANDVANIAGTYGHYLSRLAGRANEPLKLTRTPLVLPDDAGRHRVLQGYAEDVAAEIECDLCYIDPPYMKRQYAANYHVLETLAREDEPEAIGVSGLRPWRDQYSNFCTKTRIRDSFRAVFSRMRCPHFLVSYSEDGLLDVEQLRELFLEFGDVTVKTFSHKRFKSNNSRLLPTVTEYLIHVRLK